MYFSLGMRLKEDLKIFFVVIKKNNIYLFKIIMRWIFTCKINKTQDSMNKKQVINFSFYKTKAQNTIIYRIQCKNQKLN